MSDDGLRLISWNLNGIRATYKKGVTDWFNRAAPDIICLQETRAEAHQLKAELARPKGYHGYWNHSRQKRGYSGTVFLTRQEPLEVQFGLGIDELYT